MTACQPVVGKPEILRGFTGTSPGDLRHVSLSDFNELAIRVADVVPQFRGLDSRLGAAVKRRLQACRRLARRDGRWPDVAEAPKRRLALA